MSRRNPQYESLRLDELVENGRPPASVFAEIFVWLRKLNADERALGLATFRGDKRIAKELLPDDWSDDAIFCGRCGRSRKINTPCDCLKMPGTPVQQSSDADSIVVSARRSKRIPSSPVSS